MAPRLRFVVPVALAVAVTAQVSGWQRFTKQDADRFQGKLGKITSFAEAPPQTQARAQGQTAAQTPAQVKSGAAVLPSQQTQLTDVELNSYLRYNIKNQVPVGIVEPTLSAVGDGRVKGTAVIDLDAVRKQKQRGWADPLSYMMGKLPLTASGLLVTQNGVGRFQLESAELSGITIPKSLVQELLSYYSKTADKPNGISIDDPFELPARIKEIRVGKGEAMVVQ